MRVNPYFEDWESGIKRGFFNMYGGLTKIVEFVSMNDLYEIGSIGVQLDYKIQKNEVGKIIGKGETHLGSKIRTAGSGYVVDYPLVCFTEEESPGTLIFTYLDQENENHKMLSVQVSGEVLLYCQMIPTTHIFGVKPSTSIKFGALTLDLHSKAAFIYQFEFEKNVCGNKILDVENLKTNVQILSQK